MKKKLNVILLGLVSFLNDMSSEIIAPVLPLLITSMGGSGVIVGLVGGLREAVASLLKTVSGFWSDKVKKRKVFVFSGYLTSSVFKLVLVFVTSWQQLLAVVGLERVGKGMRDAPRDAIISESMPKKKGKAFGLHRAFDTSGAILGSILAFLLFWYLGLSFKTIILIAALLAFLSLIPIKFVKEQKFEKNKSFKFNFRQLSLKLKLFFVIAGIFALANFSYMFFVLKAKSAFTGKLAIGIPLLLYVLYNMFYAGFSIPLGVLADKIGKRKVIIAGYLLFALVCLGFAFFNSLWMYILLFALYGLVYAITDANQRAIVSDLSEEKVRATSLGIYHTIIGLMALPSSLIAGWLWNINTVYTFLFASCLSLSASVLFFTLRKRFV